MTDTLREYFFHKPPDLAPIHLRNGTHFISKTNLPDTKAGDLLVAMGPHRRLKGPLDIRSMSYQNIISDNVDIKAGTYICVQVLCDPTEDYVQDPTIEVIHRCFD